MAFDKVMKCAIGGATIAVFATTGIGFVPAPTELPTVTVYHNPT